MQQRLVGGKLFHIILISILLFILGCDYEDLQKVKSNDKQVVSSSATLKPERTFSLDSLTVEEKLNVSTVTCTEKDNCPDFAASILYVDYVYDDELDSTTSVLSLCSGQLVSENEIIANRHCLPQFISNPGSYCTGFVKIYFPETHSAKAVSVNCSRVETVSEGFNPKEPTYSRDWVVLRLEEKIKNRKPIEIGFSGVEENKIYTTFPSFNRGFNPQTGGFDIKIEERQCSLLYDSTYTKLYTNKYSPFVSFSCNKKMEEGNSGALLFDNQKVAQSILSWGISTETLQPKEESFHQTNKQESKNITADSEGENSVDIVGGMNLYCSQLNNSEVKPSCDWSQFDERHDQRDKMSFHLSYLRAKKKQISDLQKNKDLGYWSDSFGWRTNVTQLFPLDEIRRWKKDFIENLNEDQTQAIQNLWLKSSLPLIPICVHEKVHSELDKIHFVPFFNYNLNKLELSKMGAPIVKLNFEKVWFEKVREYKGLGVLFRWLRLSEEKRAEFIHYFKKKKKLEMQLEKMGEAKLKCLSMTEEKNLEGCDQGIETVISDLKTIKMILSKWQEKNKIDDKVIGNEIQFMKFNNIRQEFTLSYCKEEKHKNLKLKVTDGNTASQHNVK